MQHTHNRTANQKTKVSKADWHAAENIYDWRLKQLLDFKNA